MEQRITKLQAPRTALLKLLDSLMENRIIYIHAPAGFGKTVSSNLWLKHRESLTNVRQTMVSLDEYDDKTSEFCKRFVSALSNLQPENTALSRLSSNPVFKTAPVEFVLQAISILAETQSEYILALDDLHVIKNVEILNLLPVLFKRMLKNFTILLLSRAAPPSCFSEMTAKGELAVIDGDDLQFTSQEIKALFDGNGHHISSKQADEILMSTGGWAIGIRTLLLADEKSYNKTLTARHLEGFIKTHIWERWDDKYKSFMMLTGVAEELTLALCDYLIASNILLKKGKKRGYFSRAIA